VSTAIQTFRIEGMHCASCALLIDDTLQDLRGVRSSQTSMKKGRSIVELDPESTPAGVITEVITAVTELGYSAHHLS
jgi:copper chaperone